MQDSKIDFAKESYTLDWLGKSYARLLANEKPLSVMSEDEDFNLNKTTENLLIKGDNLEVLKHLKNAYYKSIKMIYIDPPYNTGTDFVYQDDRKFTADELSQKAGVSEEEARRILEFIDKGSNSHSAWLTFMYPRLYLARQLLADDGAIFISIDDNEQAQLKMLCDEIFGEENFICNFCWQKNFAPKNDNKYISESVDYILCFAKNKNNFKRNLLLRQDKHLKGYSNPDNDPRGDWASGSILVTTFSENAVYKITAPNGKIHNPPRGRSWRYSKNTFYELLNDNRIWFGKDGSGVPRVKRFLSEMPNGIVPQNLLLYTDVGSSQEGNGDLKNIFKTQIFDFPKPVNLIKHFIQISTNKSDIILDFFAGSGTTAQAIMTQNLEDSGNRKFILVQLDEKINEGKNKTAYDFCKNVLKSGNPTIFDITKERLIRARNRLVEENQDKDLSEFDLDFKIYEITKKDKFIEDMEKFNYNSLLPLYECDTNAIMTTWKLYDGIKLDKNLKEIKLKEYITHYDGDKKLYLINPNFTHDDLVALVEKIDSDKTFKPNVIVIYGKHFESAMQNEICHNLNVITNAKSIELKIIIRDI